MNGFQRRKEMKMNSILQSAYDLFLVRGIKEVSIAEIAGKAKVSQVSIYNFFDSKENLARQAIFTYMNEKMSAVEDLIDSKLTFREKFEKMFLDTIKNENSTDQEFYQSVIWNDPMVQSFIEEYYQTRTIPLILHLVEQGKKEGCVDSNISTEAVLLYLSAYKNMLSQTNITKKARSDIGTLFFYGLQGKPVDANSFGNVDK